MRATIWEHWFTWYVTYEGRNGNKISTEHFASLEDAMADARRWNAVIVMK